MELPHSRVCGILLRGLERVCQQRQCLIAFKITQGLARETARWIKASLKLVVSSALVVAVARSTSYVSRPLLLRMVHRRFRFWFFGFAANCSCCIGASFVDVSNWRLTAWFTAKKFNEMLPSAIIASEETRASINYFLWWKFSLFRNWKSSFTAIVSLERKENELPKNCPQFRMYQFVLW